MSVDHTFSKQHKAIMASAVFNDDEKKSKSRS